VVEEKGVLAGGGYGAAPVGYGGCAPDPGYVGYGDACAPGYPGVVTGGLVPGKPATEIYCDCKSDWTSRTRQTNNYMQTRQYYSCLLCCWIGNCV